MNRLPFLGVVFLLTACAGAVPSHVRQYREGPTGLGDQETASAFLVRYGTPEEAGDFPDKKQYFENCLKEGLERRRVKVLLSSALPPGLSAALPAGEALPDPILARIGSGSGEGGWTGPRFLVALEAGTKESEPKDIVYMDAGGQAFGLVMGQTRVRTTDLRAYVFDPVAPRYLGRVESTTWGYVGWEMPILYCILPCGPIPHYARTEKRACEDLAVDLAEFLRRGSPVAPQGEGR